MVEFGLKLLDNRVSEWSQAYIDYEKLKVLLKKAKDAQHKSHELEMRNPPLAAQVKKSFEEEVRQRSGRGEGTAAGGSVSVSRMGSFVMSRSPSAASLREVSGGERTPPLSASPSFRSVNSEEVTRQYTSAAVAPPSSSKHPSNASLSSMGSATDETAALLPRKCGGGSTTVLADASSPGPTPYGTQGFADQRAATGLIERNISLSNLTRSIASSVTGYFTRSNYTDKLRDSYKECYMRKYKFDSFLRQELVKVDKFYSEKLQELTQRLDHLVESVGVPEPSLRDDSIDNTDGGGAKSLLRRRKNLVTKVKESGRRVKSILARGGHRHDNDSTLDSVDEDDVGDGEQQPDEQGRIVLRAESDSIKRAIIDLYRTAKLLQNFSIMNYTGFVKVIKKHDKNFPEDKGKFKGIFNDVVVKDGAEAEQLCDRMERIFASWFCGKNMREARAQLLPKKGDALEMDWTQLRLGFRLGMCSILALWVCWDSIWGVVHKGHSTIGGRTAFPVFRASGGLLLWHWCWGCSVFIWSRYRVNYIFLFDFDPRIVESPVKIFNDVVDETLVFLICMLLYYKAGVNSIPSILPPGGYPFILVLYTFAKCFIPWRQRGPLWKSIAEVVSAPFTSPAFFTIYVADVFTSMVKVFQDMLWTFCFIFSGDFSLAENATDEEPHNWQHTFWYKNVLIPMVCLFPLWIRFNQCLRRYIDTGKRCPNLANAFKYALSQTVTLFGAFHPLYMYLEHDDNHGGQNLFQLFWMGLFVSSSLYSFFWDVYMDWGLGRPQYAFLGPRLMYPQRWYYYAAICADFFLRFMWVLTLLPPQSGAKFELPNYLSAVSMSVELIRRMFWGMFRLEQEHRHNTEGYRRVDFVPLHFNTGHDHKYNKLGKHRGKTVLAEVAAVSAVVVGVSIASVIAARKSAHVM